MVNQKYLDKAETLIEALPYIQRFNRKIVVVKYGGSAMLDEELKANVIKDVVLLKLIGFKPIIVHGGGKEISRWVNKVGMEPRFVNGLRVTDKDTMEIAEMVLAKVNKELVTLVESLGVQAVGISGKDGGLLQCHKKLSKGEDIGYVGDIEKVNPKVLQDLLERDFLPIVFPVGFDTNFDSYNINADDAACAIAEAVHAEKLVFLSDIEALKNKTADILICHEAPKPHPMGFQVINDLAEKMNVKHVFHGHHHENFVYRNKFSYNITNVGFRSLVDAKGNYLLKNIDDREK